MRSGMIHRPGAVLRMGKTDQGAESMTGAGETAVMAGTTGPSGHHAAAAESERETARSTPSTGIGDRRLVA